MLGGFVFWTKIEEMRNIDHIIDLTIINYFIGILKVFIIKSMA